MRLIAFDTATDTLHLAAVNGELVRVQQAPGGPTASAALLPALQALMAEAGLSLAELDAIAFGRGPGAFTGLRTACSVAQGLAIGAGKPVLLIDTLMAVAESAHQLGHGDAIWAATDARMGEIYAQHWVRDAGAATWQAQGPAALYAPAALLSAIQTVPAVLAGNALAAYPELSAVSDCCVDAAPNGAALATLAQATWRRGEAVDPTLALPLYVRDKVAQTTAERAAAR